MSEFKPKAKRKSQSYLDQPKYDFCTVCSGYGYIYTDSKETPNGGETFGLFKADCPACSV